MEARGRALLWAYVQLGLALLQSVLILLFLTSDVDPDKKRALSKEQQETVEMIEKFKKFGYFLIPLPFVPIGLVLVGVLKDAVCCLKWGIGFNCVLSGFMVTGVIVIVPICVLIPTGKGPCFVEAIFAILVSAWYIWGLRACNEYYSQITGEPPVCVCCVCCCFKTNLAGPGMMGPGNIVMYSPSGQPIYGPPGTAVQMQPSYSQMTPSQQQMWMQQQQQQQPMMQQQEEQ